MKKNIKETVIFRETDGVVNVYDTYSNKILDDLFAIFDYSKTDQNTIKKEYNWFSKKYNYKETIYIYIIKNGGLSCGVLDKDIEILNDFYHINNFLC